MGSKPISSERLNEFFAQMPAYLEPHGERLFMWVAVAESVTAKVAACATTMIEEEIVFIVRLSGVLSDLRGRFSGPTPADIMAHADARALLREEHRMRVVDAIAGAYAALDEDELLWLEFRRHEQSHPILDGYRPKANDGDRWDKWESKILDRKVLPIADVMQRCTALEKTHGGFPLVARAIARKVLPHLTALVPAMNTLSSLMLPRSPSLR
jgi:hypothetical protein